MRLFAVKSATVTRMVAAPGPRMMTEPSGSTVAVSGLSLVHLGRIPTSTEPLLSVTVAARWSVSPIACAVSAVGLTPSQVAPKVPTVLWLSGSPTTPNE
jgi:hypothetical protein